MQLNKTIDINLGYRCNVECKFCYYRPFLKSKFFDLGMIKKQLRIAKGIGIEGIDFTGGEPTIYKDLISAIAYARSLGFKKICLITNGIMLANMDFFKRLRDTGVNDILFSLHGHKAELHDYLMGAKGSFEKCLKAIENARTLGVRVRTNSVITQYNYKNLPDIARLTRKIAPETTSLINLNPCVCLEIYNRELVPTLKNTAPYTKEAIDILKDVLKVNVMYIPFCLMQQYEQYVHNMHQIQYDPDEWDYFSRRVVQDNFVNTLRFVAVRGIPKISFRQINSFSISEFLHKAMIEALCGKNNIKFLRCRKCRYYFICDGPWKKYISLYGGDEFKPIKNKKISNPTFFMEREYQCGYGAV